MCPSKSWSRSRNFCCIASGKFDIGMVSACDFLFWLNFGAKLMEPCLLSSLYTDISWEISPGWFGTFPAVSSFCSSLESAARSRWPSLPTNRSRLIDSWKWNQFLKTEIKVEISLNKRHENLLWTCNIGGKFRTDKLELTTANNGLGLSPVISVFSGGGI